MPIVFMNDHTRFVGKVIRFMRMPAGVALAYDGCGGAESGRHDHRCGDCGCGKDFSEHILLVSMGPFARRAKHLGGAFGSEAERKFSRDRQAKCPLASACFFNEAGPLLADDASNYARGHRAHIGKIT
jgi:hypothetical protein